MIAATTAGRTEGQGPARVGSLGHDDRRADGRAADRGKGPECHDPATCGTAHDRDVNAAKNIWPPGGRTSQTPAEPV